MANDIKVRLNQLSPSTSEAEIRGHKIKIDRPTAKDGTDLGPMGGELFLAALGGCFMSNLLAAIKARSAEVSQIQTDVIGTLAESPARFVALELRVSAHCQEPLLLEKLVEIAERGCIMVNTLKGKLELTVGIDKPA
jgi:putative redox protein